MFKKLLSIVLFSLLSLSAYSSNTAFSSCQGIHARAYSQGHFGDWDRVLRRLNHIKLPAPDKILKFGDKAIIPQIQSDNPVDFFASIGMYLKSGNLLELYKTETSLACIQKENINFTNFVLLKANGFNNFVKPHCPKIRSEISLILEEHLAELRQALTILQHVHPISFTSKMWVKSTDEIFPDKIRFPAEVKPFSLFSHLENLSLGEKEAVLKLIFKKLQPVTKGTLTSATELAKFLVKNQEIHKRSKVMQLLQSLVEEQRLRLKEIINDHPFLAFYTNRSPFSQEAQLESFSEIRNNTLEILHDELTIEKLGRYPINIIDQFLSHNNRKFCPAALAWQIELKKREFWSAIKWLSADVGICTFSAVTGAWPFCLAILASHTGKTLYDSKKKLNDSYRRAFSQAFSMDLAHSIEEIKRNKKEFSLQVLLAPLAATGGGKIVTTGARYVMPNAASTKIRNILVREKKPITTPSAVYEESGALQKAWSFISSGLAAAQKYVFQPIGCLIGACKQAKQIVEKAMMLKPFEELKPWISYPTTTLGTLFVVYPELQEEYSYVRFKYILDHPEHPLHPFLQGFKYNLNDENLAQMNRLVHPLYRVLETPQLADIKQQLLNKEIAVTDLETILNDIDDEYETLASVPLNRNTYVQHLKSRLSRFDAVLQRKRIKDQRRSLNLFLSENRSTFISLTQLNAVNETENTNIKVGYRFKYVHPIVAHTALPDESIKDLTSLAFGLSDKSLRSLSQSDQKQILNISRDYFFLSWVFEYVLATELAKEIPNAHNRQLQIQLSQSLIKAFSEMYKSYSFQLGADSDEMMHFLSMLQSVIPADKDYPVTIGPKWRIENTVNSIQIGNMLFEYLFMAAQIKINSVIYQNGISPNYIPYHFSGPKIKSSELSEHVIRMNLSDISRTLLITEGPPPELSETISSLSKDVKKMIKRQLF